MKGDEFCCNPGNFEYEDIDAGGLPEEVEDESSFKLLLVFISEDSTMCIIFRCNPACGTVIVPR